MPHTTLPRLSEEYRGVEGPLSRSTLASAIGSVLRKRGPSRVGKTWVAVQALHFKLPSYGYVVNKMVLNYGNLNLSSLTATQKSHSRFP